MKKLISVHVDEDLFETLKHRAKMNNRALSREVVHLMEVAIAVKGEHTHDIIQLLSKSGCLPGLSTT